MPEIRMLTVQQPAAGAILALGKHVENRSWMTRYRGRLAIHAGAQLMPPGHPFWRFVTYVDAIHEAQLQQRALPELRLHSAIIGVADLVDAHWGQPGCCDSPWAERNPWPCHWTLEDVRPLSEPYPMAGGLGLRKLPPDVAEEIERRAA